MGRALRAARNRGIGRLYMICLPENGRMRKVAKKYDARLAWRPGEIEGNLYPAHPDYFSLLHELLDDTSGFMAFMLDLGLRGDQSEQKSA
jgi:RimJ/RimL family protein N-acetyltransferase